MERLVAEMPAVPESRSQQSKQLQDYITGSGFIDVHKALEQAWKIFFMKELCACLSEKLVIDSSLTPETVLRVLEPIDDVWRLHIFPIFANYARSYPDVLDGLTQDAFHLVIRNIFRPIIHREMSKLNEDAILLVFDNHAIVGLFGRVLHRGRRQENRTQESLRQDGTDFIFQKIMKIDKDGSLAQGIADLVAENSSYFSKKLEAVYQHHQNTSSTNSRVDYRIGADQVSFLFTRDNSGLWKPSNYGRPPSNGNGERGNGSKTNTNTVWLNGRRVRKPKNLPTRKRIKQVGGRDAAIAINSLMLDVLRKGSLSATSSAVDEDEPPELVGRFERYHTDSDSDEDDDDEEMGTVDWCNREDDEMNSSKAAESDKNFLHPEVTRVHGGIDHAETEKYAEFLSNEFVDCLREKFRYLYVDEWASLPEDKAIALRSERELAGEETGCSVEARKMETTVHGNQKGYSAVMAIHNGTSEERRKKVLEEFNDFPQAQNTGMGNSGKTRFTSYTGPPGTYFMLGSEKTVHVTQKPTALQEEHFQKITKLLMAEQENFLRTKGLGYVITQYDVGQNLFGIPSDVAYQEHNDVYFTNTSHNMHQSLVRNGSQFLQDFFITGDPLAESAAAEIAAAPLYSTTTDYETAVDEHNSPVNPVNRSAEPVVDVEVIHHGSSKFLPTVSETQVTTFCLGENLVEMSNDGEEMSDSEGIPKGLVSVKWYNRQHKPTGEIRCGNDTIHIQFYFTQLYFTHKVVSKIKRAQAQKHPPVRLVSSMRASGTLLSEEHCCLLRDIVTGHEGGIGVATPETSRMYRGCLDFVRGIGTIQQTEPSLHDEWEDLSTIAKYMDKLGSIGVSLNSSEPTPTDMSRNHVEAKHISTFPSDKKAVEDFERDYGQKFFSLTAGVPAYQFMSNAETVKFLYGEGVTVCFDDVPLSSGPTLPGHTDPLYQGELVSEREVRRYFSLQKNNRRQVTWAKEDTRHVAHIYSEAYKNDEYLLKVGAEIQRRGLDLGDTLAETEHFTFQDVFHPCGSGGSATRDGFTMPDLRKTGLDDPSGHPPVNQSIRRPTNSIEDERDLNYVLFAAAGRQAPVHCFSSIGCPEGTLVYIGLYKVSSLTYAKMDKKAADRQFEHWWKNYPGLFSEGDKDYFMFRTQPHFKMEMVHMGLGDTQEDDGNDEIEDCCETQDCSAINIQPGLLKGWMADVVSCRFVGRSNIHIGFDDFLNQWIKQKEYRKFYPAHVKKTLDHEKRSYRISIEDWLDSVPYFAAAGALRILGCSVSNSKSHPLRGDFSWLSDETGELLIAKKETVERMGYALRASPFPMRSPHVDVVTVHFINFCRSYLHAFVPENRHNDMKFLDPSCLRHDRGVSRLVHCMGSLVFAAVINRYTGSGPWFRDYAQWEGNSSSLLLPTIETISVYLDYLCKRYAKNPARLSGSLSTQHENAVASYANKTPAGMRHLVQNLSSKIKSSVSFALALGCRSKDQLSRCLLVLAGVLQEPPPTHEFFVTSLILMLEECLPPGGRLDKVEWVCYKIAGDICTVFGFPFGEPNECVTGTGGTEGLDLLWAGCEMNSAEKASKLLEEISRRAVADPDWAEAVAVDVVDGIAYDSFTGCRVGHLYVDQDMCKLYKWRIYGTASRKISDRRQTDREECHPQHDPDNLYCHTTRTLRLVSERQILALQRMIASNRIPKLNGFFVEEREAIYWKNKGDCHYVDE